MHRGFLLAVAFSCLVACAGPAHPPTRDQHGAILGGANQVTAQDRARIEKTVRLALTQDLEKFPDVERAYLLTHPNGELFMLVPIFDGVPNNAALTQATRTFARVAPDSPPLQLLLPAKATWKAEMARREPFYVRP